MSDDAERTERKSNDDGDDCGNEPYVCNEAECEPWRALIRASAEYVVVSRDLRAAVIETARARIVPAHRRLRLLGIVLAAAIGLTAVSIFLAQFDLSQSNRPLAQRTILRSGDELWLLAQSHQTSAPTHATHNVPWYLVDAYRQLRERQAAAMESAATH